MRQRAEVQTVLRCRTRLMQIDASALGGSYSNAGRFHGHDRTAAQLRAVLREDLNGSRSVSFSSEADETHDARWGRRWTTASSPKSLSIVTMTCEA